MRRIFFLDDAVEQMNDAATVGCVFLRVRGLDDRSAFAVELSKDLHDLFALFGIQVSRRLVGQYECGPDDQGTGDGHELLLSSGELGWGRGPSWPPSESGPVSPRSTPLRSKPLTFLYRSGV